MQGLLENQNSFFLYENLFSNYEQLYTNLFDYTSKILSGAFHILLTANVGSPKQYLHAQKQIF